MTRFLPLAALLTIGCYDFAGEKRVLGFETDAVVDGLDAWTPDAPLAAGTAPKLEVSEILATEKEPSRAPDFSASKNLALHADGTSVFVRGSNKGWVEAAVDGVRDHFRVRWSDAVAGTGIDPIDREEVDHIYVLDGEQGMVGFRLLDRRGRSLGYLVEELDVTASKGLTLDADHPLRFGGEGQLTVGLRGLESTTVQIHSVDIDDVDGLEIRTAQMDGVCTMTAVLTAEGTPVQSFDRGFTWSHVDSEEAIVPCESSVAVQWNDLAAKAPSSPIQ